MTILPLVERELRVRARSRAVYWTRFAVALVGLLICLPMLDTSSRFPGMWPAVIGHSAFTRMVTAAFILSCGAGFLTVDGISRERREGTLGLLCLTRVRALDVLLGSFGAGGITCLGALLAVLPVIVLPLLTGGVTGGEAFRTMLVLLDTLLLSLAAGLWASAGARGWWQSARSLVAVLLLIVVVPALPLVGPEGGVLSPLSAFNWAGDAAYRIKFLHYWISLGAVHGISWLLLIGAGFRLRRAMREGERVFEKIGLARLPRGDAEKPVERPGFTLVSWRIGSGKMPDKADPVRWLVRRQRGIKAAIWTGTLIGVFHQFGIWRVLRSLGWISPTRYSSWATSLAFSVVSGCLFAWVASRFLVEARRSGELELLLTTPVGATTLISHSRKELQRLFVLPAIVLLAPMMVEGIIILTQNTGTTFFESLSYRAYVAATEIMAGINLIASIGALIWAGIGFGLRARSQASAIVWIVILIDGVPYATSLVGPFVLRMFPGDMMWEYVALRVAQLFYYLWLMRWARRRLAAELASGSPAPFNLSESMAEARAGLAALVSKARHWPPTPSR